MVISRELCEPFRTRTNLRHFLLSDLIRPAQAMQIKTSCALLPKGRDSRSAAITVGP